MSTDQQSFSIAKGPASQSGWKQLQLEQSSAHIGIHPTGTIKSLINLVHISDTHICDAQSPARVEYLDRYADPHHPASSILGALVGTYRAHEILTTQVLESMIQRINQIELTPITKGKIDSVIITGDLTDNAQINELNWLTTLMSGGKIRPDSGSHEKWEGAGGDFYSPFFWNPHGTPKGEVEDFPRKLYGYPVIPELLDAVRAPFYATGLRYNWLAVHGNHDALLQGTVVPDEFLRGVATSASKIIQLSDEEAFESLQRVSEIGPAAYPGPVAATTMPATIDLSRDFVDEKSWVERFTHVDQVHGFSSSNLGTDKKYWRKDFDQLTILALDTVNPFGGWQGSIDQTQFRWLKDQVDQLRDRYVVITSHHPVREMYNDYTPHLEPRVLGAEIEKYLIEQSNVVAWICGHNHRHRIEYFGADKAKGFWQIETSSLIDWPQQGRIIEIYLDESDQLCIATTPIDHQGSVLLDHASAKLDEVNSLSGLSRILSLNDWQRRGGAFPIELNEGESKDGAVILTLPKRV